MEKVFEKLIEVIENNYFTVTVEEDNEDYIIFDFGKYSPCEHDFHFQAEAENRSIDSLLDNLFSVYEDFDVSEETYLWLDDSGHGKNGAPYDIKDLYEDMEACEQYIEDMCDIANNFYDEWRLKQHEY